MPRKAAVTLADIWKSADAREAVANGTKRLKLPIAPSEYPRTHAMSQRSYGRTLVSGKNGVVQMWLIGPYIISYLYEHNHTLRNGVAHFWATRYPSSVVALRVFATMCCYDDEVQESMRGHRLAFDGGEQVTVYDDLDHDLVRSLIDDRYCEHRRAGAEGIVLSRALRDREDLWLVDHGDDQVAVYLSRELR